MRSIQSLYKVMQKKYPETSDYIQLLRAVKHRKFSKKSLRTALNKLVSKDSYSKGDKKAIIELLKKFSDMPEEGQNEDKNAPQCTIYIASDVSILQL